MKIKYLFVIIIILLITTGCKKSICEKHGHDYLEATCLNPSICKNCGEQVGTSLGHNFEKVETINPTCLSDGYNFYKCTRCNYKKMETIESTGHDLIEIELLPTCTEDGKHTIKCINCDYKKEQKIKKLGHVEVIEKGYEATCTSKGLTDGIYCEVCKVILKTPEEILELEHTFDNMHDDECNICGFKRDSDYLRVKDEMNLYLGFKLDDLMSLTQDLESIIICPDSLFYIFTVEEKYNVVAEYPAMADDAAARIQVYYKKEPILEDFESIQKGMTVYEVVEIIGVPSDYSTTSSGMKHYVSYDVDENTKFTVIFVDKLNELNLVNDTKFYEK